MVEYEYDLLDRLVKLTAAAGVTTYEYDAAGQLVREQRPDGAVTETSYTPLGKVERTETRTAAGALVSRCEYTYDAAGQALTELRQGAGGASETRYSYTPAGEIASEERTQAGSTTLTRYSFDAFGNKSGEQTLVNGVVASTTRYYYNQKDQLTRKTVNGVTAATYAYDPDGNLANKREGGVTTTYTYTQDNKLETVRANGELQAAYTYDANGLKAFELLRKERPGTEQVTEYKLQSSKRRVLQKYTAQGARALFTAPWQTSETRSEPNLWAYVAAYTASGFSPIHREGFLQAARALWQSITELSPFSRPVIDLLPVTQQELAPRTVIRTSATGETHDQDIVVVYYEPTLYAYDLTKENPQVLAEQAAANQVRDLYLYGAAGRESRVSAGAKQPEYYVYDGRGSVSEVLSMGKVTAALRYNAYGSLLQGEPEQDRVFAYNGEQYTPQTGLQYLRARHYDPQLGAFTTRDTYLGDLKTPISQNRYTYAHNNPVRYADPSGHRLDVDGPRGPGTTSPSNIRDSYKPAPSRPTPSKPKPSGGGSSSGSGGSAAPSGGGGGGGDGGGHEEPPYDPYQFVRLNYFSLTAKAKAGTGSFFKSVSQKTAAAKANIKRTVKEKVTSSSSWWNSSSTKSSGFADGVNSAISALSVKNSPSSPGNRSMIGTGAGALTNLPELGTLVRTLGGITGAVSGGAQIIGGIAATATGAGAAVGIPMILKGAVEVVVSTQVLAAAMQEDETKKANPQIKDTSKQDENVTPTPERTFPEDPADFNPEGLTKRTFETPNGKITKWFDEDGNAVYEWDEDLANGSHYHVIGEDGNTRLPSVSGETHFRPGDRVP